MESRLEVAIAAYLVAIELAVAKLEASGIPAPESLEDWLCRDFPQLGHLQDGTEYFKHGFGIAVNLPEGAVDFDFGPNGERDQIDLFKLIKFAMKRQDRFGFRDDQELRFVFERAAETGYLTHIEANNYRLSVS